MKLENGNLSIGMWDILAVLFLPITILVGPSVWFARRHKAAPYHREWIWKAAQVLWWGPIIATAGYFGINTLTFHRNIVNVETVQHTEVVGGEFGPSEEQEVTDFTLVTIEEHPKIFNVEETTTYKFCRSAKGEWFEVQPDGSLVLLESPVCLGAWETNRAIYLELLLNNYNEQRKTEQEHSDLQEQVRIKLGN